MFAEQLQQCHQRAFTVSAEVSPSYLTKIRELFCLALETAIPFDEWQIAVQHLNDTGQVTLEVQE